MIHFQKLSPVFTVVSESEALVFFPPICIGDGVHKSVNTRFVGGVCRFGLHYDVFSGIHGVSGLGGFMHITLLMDIMSFFRPYKFNLLTGSNRHIFHFRRPSIRFGSSSACCRAPKSNANL